MARKKSKGGSAGKSVKIDFSGVESFAKMDDGEHLLKVTEVTKEKGDAGDYLKWVLENEDGARVYHNTSLSEASLWATKGFLEALGVEIPEEEMELELEDMVDKEILAQVEGETYQGKRRPKIVDYSPAEEGSSSKKEKDDAPGFEDMDEKALKKFIKKNELDVDPDDFPKEKKLRAAVEEAYEESQRGSKKSGKKSDKKGDKPTEEDVDDMDEDELADVIKDHELDVDLDDYKTLRKKQAAVKEALE